MASSVKTIGASNQIDCFFEYFFENICLLKGYNDANDLGLHNKSSNTYKNAPNNLRDMQMPVKQRIVEIKPLFVASRQNHFPLWENKYDYLFAQEITPPPPKENMA